MSQAVCPRCENSVNGPYCSQCGASLNGEFGTDATWRPIVETPFLALKTLMLALLPKRLATSIIDGRIDLKSALAAFGIVIAATGMFVGLVGNQSQIDYDRYSVYGNPVLQLAMPIVQLFVFYPAHVVLSKESWVIESGMPYAVMLAYFSLHLTVQLAFMAMVYFRSDLRIDHGTAVLMNLVIAYLCGWALSSLYQTHRGPIRTAVIAYGLTMIVSYGVLAVVLALAGAVIGLLVSF